MQSYHDNRSVSIITDDQYQKLELFVSCRNLTDLDIITTTDSFLVVRIKEPNTSLRQILRTKVYNNSLDPDYAETVIINFFFQITQTLIFEVYHFDNPPKLVGKTQATVGQIFGAPNNAIKKSLMNRDSKESGQIILQFEKVEKQDNRIISMNISAKKLPLPYCLFDCFKPDPFFRIFRKKGNQQLKVYESQVFKNSTDPIFKKLTISERKLCQKNEQMIFGLRFFDYNLRGNHNEIGTSKIKLIDLINRKKQFDIMKDQQRYGVCEITNMQRVTKYQFGDYISRGLELALITCIDFTSSNLRKQDPNSLHHIPNGGMSKYEEALFEVSKILLDYDYDKLVPLYGFGAKFNLPNFNTNGNVSHCFPLNGNPANPDVFQINGIMQTYRQALPYLEFGSPTLFGQLLTNAIHQAQQIKNQKNKYIVLLILTDGEIHDEQEVISKIIDCCNLPISLIIIGIGNGNFASMHRLDDDECRLVDSRGRRNTRDLVQFVEFKRFQNNAVELARQVLEELPRQVEEYFQNVGVVPQQISNARQNVGIMNILNNHQRQQGVQPVYANNVYRNP